MRVLLLPGSRTSPAARFRILQFVEPLQDLGHEVEVRVIRPNRQWKPGGRGYYRGMAARVGTLSRIASVAWMAKDAATFDVIVMNRDFIPEVRVAELEPLVAKINPHLVLDIDDAIYLGRRERKMRKILPHFGAVFAGNEELAGYLRRHNGNVHVVPTVADGDHFRPVVRRAPGPVRIGWSGSSGPLHLHLPLVREALERVAREHEFELVVIADEPPAWEWNGVRTRFIRWRAETEVEDLQKLDVGLMPLPNRAFERAKCAAKAVLYMAVGIPAVVSPVGASAEVVVDGVTGFHCSDNEEWARRLGVLVGDAGLRRRLGAAGRARFEEWYSLRAVLPRWLGLLEAVASGRAARQTQCEPQETGSLRLV